MVRCIKQTEKTPAEGVIIYLYHTDATGHYPVKQDSKGWEKRHGYLRGWMRTNEKGEYKFATMRPVAYPGGTEPAHIHMIIKEPGINEYYIDDILFRMIPCSQSLKEKAYQQRRQRDHTTFGRRQYVQRRKEYRTR